MVCHRCSVVSGPHRSEAGAGRCGLYSSVGYLWSNQQLLVNLFLYWLFPGAANTSENMVVVIVKSAAHATEM